MTVVSIDVETSSYEPLQQVGAEAYARGRTVALLLAWHVVGDPAPPQVWRRGEPPPDALCGLIASGALFSGWNVIGFDRLIWRRDLVARCGFPVISDDNWLDSMHRAAAANLPRSLEGCAYALDVGFVADLKDRAKLLRITNANRTPVPSAEDLAWLEARCVQDVQMEEAVLLQLPPWPTVEPWRRMPHIDRTINDRGVMVDLPLVRGLARAAVLERARLDDEMHRLTDGRVAKTTTVESLKEWLVGRGVALPPALPPDADEEDSDPDDDENPDAAAKESRTSPWRLRKSDIADLLARDDVPAACRQALEMRWEAGRASPAKLHRMLLMAGPDSRLRGILRLGGAQATLRWSAGDVQLHNMVRDVFANPDEVAEVNGLDAKRDQARVLALAALSLRTAIEAGRTGDPELLRALYQTRRRDLQGRWHNEGVLVWIARMLRRTLAARSGMLFVNGDFANIEARIPVWLAGQEDVVQQFARGEDVYRIQAAPVYGLAPGQLNKEQRQIGKVMRLFLGFLGGVNAFIPAAMNYGLRINREDAAEYVRIFRDTNPYLVAFGDALLYQAINAVVAPGLEYIVPPKNLISWFVQNDCLHCRLPSGRLLRYWQPRLRQGFWPDGSPKREPELTVLFMKGKFGIRRTMWRGLALENCLGSQTKVVTRQGIKHLVHVLPDDELWDGDRWVRHDGVAFQGIRETLSFGGIRMTADHEVFIDAQPRACRDVSFEYAAASFARYHRLPDRATAGDQAARAERAQAECVAGAVFDILNAGPRHRFTVIGDDGRPILVSNCTQAIAADLLANALVNLEDAALPVVLHVHDNAAAEVLEDRAEALLPVFRQCMLSVPSWTAGLPLDVSCEIGARFG